MLPDDRPRSAINIDNSQTNLEATCLYAILTDRRPVSRRNRASWFLRHLNKLVEVNPKSRSSLSECRVAEIDSSISEQEDKVDEDDLKLISITSAAQNSETPTTLKLNQFLVTQKSRALYLSRSVATTIILDLSPSVVSVSSQNDCIFIDSIFDAVKRVLHLLVMAQEIPSSSFNNQTSPPILEPKTYVTVLAYTPFLVAKTNQVLVQNRRISNSNIDRFIVELGNGLNRLIQETYELVTNTCGMDIDLGITKGTDHVFVFPQPLGGSVIRHPSSVLEDMFELGLFSCSLMPKLSRLSITIISDGLFSSSNCLDVFRLRSIAVSFICLGSEATQPDSNLGYTSYNDLMRFVAKTTLGVFLTHQDLIDSTRGRSRSRPISLSENPIYKLFCWTLHSEVDRLPYCSSDRLANHDLSENQTQARHQHVSKYFYIDQPFVDVNNKSVSIGADDWRFSKELGKNLEADFEQVLACLLREGYLIKDIQFRHKDTPKIIARLVLHWRYNLDLEQELTASYWSTNDPYDINSSKRLILRPFNTPSYGDTYCEIYVHGSYSFLHNFYCNSRSKRRSEYRDIAYRQFRQLIDGVLQTQDRLQYLSRFYRDSSLSKVPSFLLHGNSLLYEQPHTHRLTTTIENVTYESKTSEFQEYWQKISCMETKSWKNLMHIHTLRLVLEHDQPKHKNIHYQNANGRYTHVQCRRALSAISNFIKSYASFALLEDSTYVKFLYNKDDDLREIETSSTKGFIVIRINKLLPIIVIYLMFTSGILDSHRIQIVSYLEDQLLNCKLRSTRTSTTQASCILRSKTISPSSESCCILIRSPLERMLKVYSRNFVNDFLINNWSYGLPGSCSYRAQHFRKFASTTSDTNHEQKVRDGKSHVDGYTSDEGADRYNLVFGKYLYGVRLIQTISDLPQEIASSLAANVLSKISAVLVNLRIKQGFHIAFNNSGILNLVVELSMNDPSTEDDVSSCLCQYVVFPPTIISTPQLLSGSIQSRQEQVSNHNQPASLNGSLPHSESYPNTCQESTQNIGASLSEIKVIKEYWIEQQYGSSVKSDSYHDSLHDMRYPEVMDHLFLSDSSIFECLLTYNLLQLLCDRLSPFYELGSVFTPNESKSIVIPSPTTSINSSDIMNDMSKSESSLPSLLIEGNPKSSGSNKIPLVEKNYRFSIVRFLEDSQLASMNVLLFKNGSEYYDPVLDQGITNVIEQAGLLESQSYSAQRKLSIDGKDSETSDCMKREHRRSIQYDSLAFTSVCRLNTSLNQIFLDTLHKRLKQMHDNELKISAHDRGKLPSYLKRRILEAMSREGATSPRRGCVDKNQRVKRSVETTAKLDEGFDPSSGDSSYTLCDKIEWRCFLRKGNQENLMIVLIPTSLDSIQRWSDYMNNFNSDLDSSTKLDYDTICPIFVFRCSSTMINDHILSFLDKNEQKDSRELSLESDMCLHFGQPAKYLGQLSMNNDELSPEVLPLINCDTTSDEKTLEIVHFRAFLRKIKNTVLKSRFSALNDAYLGEVFINKDDILYYINNVDTDIQKKYHVSSQLRSLSDFIKSYEEYVDSRPHKVVKPCDQLLNSILLQKCGLFINQPIVRFNEADPLMRQLHDRKLLFLMRRNYKVELPILEENLSESRLLRGFIKTNISPINPQPFNNGNVSTVALSSSVNESSYSNGGMTTSSLSKIEGSRLMEMKCGSMGSSVTGGTSGTGTGSPSASFSTSERTKNSQTPRFCSVSQLGSLPGISTNDTMILEAFRGTKSCSIRDVPALVDGGQLYRDISLRHEAHMAEVLKRTGERKESNQYRRVLKSKGNYGQSHSAIDQALKRVDSLGRLEHFCLTPLLFSPSWRTKLAPVRDHTLELDRLSRNITNFYSNEGIGGSIALPVDAQQLIEENDDLLSFKGHLKQQEADNRWHQLVCNNYIKEYEQYIQTLGFNSVQIRYPSNSKIMTFSATSSTGAVSKPPIPTATHKNSKATPNSKPADSSVGSTSNNNNNSQGSNGSTGTSQMRRGSVSASASSLQAAQGSTSVMSASNTGYLIKFLNSGCLVFKVGFCKPYVYSFLYSIEGERFNNSNMKVNMTAFLDELDNIKVTMHLHSFTYDYHLRSMYSYISGRQMTFSPGYHLISFLDDFRKYYQKAPNYARNHILCGEVSVSDIKVNGQQLYNYMITHNSVYNMDVLEMSSFTTSFMSSTILGHVLSGEQQKQEVAKEALDASLARSHANDYVLVELKREKVRHRDGKDPDIYDCGLLIAHDGQQGSSLKNCLTLKYFLVLTNQRDLYPKLLHTYGNIISLGCHRPIRLGLNQAKQKQSEPKSTDFGLPITGPSCEQDPDGLSSSELQSSCELSGPQSIISTSNSVQSSSSGLQFGGGSSISGAEKCSIGNAIDKTSIVSQASSNRGIIDAMLEASYRSADALEVPSQDLVSSRIGQTDEQRSISTLENNNSLSGNEMPSPEMAKRSRNRHESSSSSQTRKSTGNVKQQERTICDEEITYLGYFSTDEMDMLRFLQDKTANLKAHIVDIVRQAEIHYRRDYLWQRLMQRTTKPSEELPISIDELLQLLSIVEAVELSSLDSQLTMFASLHINWHIKLIKAFCDLKHSNSNQYRIYSVRASKLLLIYIDPKCTSAFILLSIDTDKSLVEFNMLLKDKQDFGKASGKAKSSPGKSQNGSGEQASKAESSSTLADTPAGFELDQDCQQLINDFINSCAAFMWSTLLT